MSEQNNHMNDYKVIVEFNSDRIVSYLPNGQFTEEIFRNEACFGLVACKLNQLEQTPKIEFYHKSGNWRPLVTASDYSRAAITLISNHTLFVSVKEAADEDQDMTQGENIVVSRDLLTSLTAQMAKLELSIRMDRLKSTSNEVFFDIDSGNTELFDFFSKMGSTEKLEEVMRGYKKHAQWVEKFNNDEKYLEHQLETLLVLARHPVVPQAAAAPAHVAPVPTSPRPMERAERPESASNYPFTLNVFQKDLNFCFQLKNNTGVYYKNSLSIVTNLDDGAHTISVPHGIGPHNQRTFTRFKREFSPECTVADFMYFQIKDSDGSSVLFEGIRSKFDAEQSTFKLRAVNHPTLNGINLERVQRGVSGVSGTSLPSAHSSVDEGDIISTSIGSNAVPSSGGRTFEEYDFLSETEYEDY
ncbi:hypothetical protein DAKH74_019160 [Maudiozyma humilis]|uniref:Autophagy protein Atg19/Atg34 C-terminal domain-containing protein n=1 Tax=Maudiozyma humilis TaxID=51915 RepID=A0AAV5RUU5_MAUHU|nr:hypothetical protein DAKH74_019160 [Kazachstania humilis]